MKYRDVIFPAVLAILTLQSAEAGSATWNLDPASNNWNIATNWTPATVPNGQSDVATFGVSSATHPFFFEPVELGEIVFNPGASVYTISFDHGRSLNFYGAGIVNNSGQIQTFSVTLFRGVTAQILFRNDSSAGDGVVFAIDGPSFFTSLFFLDSSSAGNSTITLTGGADIYGSHMTFSEDSKAGTASIELNGAITSGAQGANTTFFDQATADHATFTAHGGTVAGAGGAILTFATSGAPSAGNATLIADGNILGADGGLIQFYDDADGGGSRVEVFDNGRLSIENAADSAAIGSLEGNGRVLLGTNNLTIGLTNASTTFSGRITGTGSGGSGGSITKKGRGRLTLTRSNSYPGGTTVSGGSLTLNNRNGSATGSGLVEVEEGTLSGRGIIAGGVVLATNGGQGTLSPGSGRPPSALTILSFLTFHSNSVDQFVFDSSTAQANTVVAGAVDLDPGCSISFRDLGNAVLPLGTTFTVISSTVADPIFGQFDNLADGSTVTVNGNKFQADYEGGDGNDLTLTVVP